MLTVWCSLIFAIFFLLIDQCSKLIIVQYMNIDEKIEIIDGFLRLNYVRNSDGAMGILKNIGINMRIPLIIITICIISYILFEIFTKKIENKFYIWSLSLIISGGLGNLIDRIFNSNGEVVDFIQFEFSWFPFTFNFADICVCTGVAILIVYLIFDYINNIKNKKISVSADNSEINENDTQSDN